MVDPVKNILGKKKRKCRTCGQVHNHMPFTDCYDSKKDGPLPDDIGQAYRDRFGDE